MLVWDPLRVFYPQAVTTKLRSLYHNVDWIRITHSVTMVIYFSTVLIFKKLWQWWLSSSRLCQICRRLIFGVRLTPLWSNFYYDYRACMRNIITTGRFWVLMTMVLEPKPSSKGWQNNNTSEPIVIRKLVAVHLGVIDGWHTELHC